MSLAAYISGWFVKADPDLGRFVTNDVVEALATLPFTKLQIEVPDADPATGEPRKGAVLVIVDAPDATHLALERLPNNKVVPISPKSQERNSMQSFLQERGVIVELGSAGTRREVAGRVARALNSSFLDFGATLSGL